MINFLLILMFIVPFIGIAALQLWLCFHITKFVFKLIPSIVIGGVMLLFLIFNALGLVSLVAWSVIVTGFFIVCLPILLAWFIFWIVS